MAFLGYALWVTLKHLLMPKGSALSPRKALALLGTLASADIVLLTTAGRDHIFGHGLGDHKAMRDFIDRLKKDHGKGWTEGWKNPARFVDQKGCHPLTKYERNSPGEALPFRLQGQEPRLH